jgi:putative hemolysin
MIILQSIIFHPVTLSAIISLLAALLLLVLSAVFSASEIGFFSLSPQILDELSDSDEKKDKNVIRLIENPHRLLATILIANNAVNMAIIFLFTFFTTTIMDFSETPVFGFIFQTIIITFLLLLFGEIMPKIYATRFARKVALKNAGFINFVGNLLAPFVTILVNSTSVVNKRMKRHNHSNISMDELSQALELTTGVQQEDTEILEGIIKFGNMRVVDIMTSRVDMVDVDIKTGYKQLLNLIIESGYSRIPVYSGSRDNIKGVLYGKDLLPHLEKPANFRWQSLVRPAFYVPETKMIDDLLSEFQKNKVHLAVVVDEYGGTSGLITLEDILEEIVGDISDEYDEEEKLYTKLDNHTFIFEAKIQLNDFYKIDEIDEEDFVKIADEVETLAGLVLELKGEIPHKDEKIGYGRYVFEVLSADNRRIKKIKLHIREDYNNMAD